MQPEKVATAQFGTEEIENLAQDATLDAYLAVGPLDSKITAAAIAATSGSRGAPKFLPVEASEAIALRHPRYEAEEIPGASSTPTRLGRGQGRHHQRQPSHPGQKRTVGSQGGGLLPAAVRRTRHDHATRPRRRAHHEARDGEGGGALGAPGRRSGHQRDRADVSGQVQRLLLVLLLLLSGIGSAAAWLRRYLNRDERDDNISRNRILAAVSEVRDADSEQDLLASQREVDAIIGGDPQMLR